MFDELTSRLETVFKKLRGYGKLTEQNMRDSLREVRRALLEADVNYKVAKDFVSRVEEEALGREVLKSLTPGQQVIGVVHEELIRLLGEKATGLKPSSKPPAVILIVGLQGSGKTTFTTKLAVHLRRKGAKPMVVAADLKRPAAIEQLKILADSVNVRALVPEKGESVLEAGPRAVAEASETGHDWVLFDTAGRMHVDEEMMSELSQLKELVSPHEILLVLDGMTGQDAVNVASAFEKTLDFDGAVLTKLDGDARGGAALSLRAVTGKPIKFVSVGEKLDALEVFHPDRMASRILGMGDIVSLVEKAGQAVDAERALEMERKLSEADFTLEDFLEQLKEVKKMGPIQDLVEMIPGFGKMKRAGLSLDENALVRVEAVINSMTPRERLNPTIIDGSRRKRIAKGSGSSVQEVNKVLKQFFHIQKLLRQMKRGRRKGLSFLPF
ncbi:MAG: signal recognition particle protein [Candidatus Eiseniibacteriota bacterium]|nr:MAG: signal recognition particle protein [Candidatus Eisenbacteria bacterium]